MDWRCCPGTVWEPIREQNSHATRQSGNIRPQSSQLRRKNGIGARKLISTLKDFFFFKRRWGRIRRTFSPKSSHARQKLSSESAYAIYTPNLAGCKSVSCALQRSPGLYYICPSSTVLHQPAIAWNPFGVSATGGGYLAVLFHTTCLESSETFTFDHELLELCPSKTYSPTPFCRGLS